MIRASEANEKLFFLHANGRRRKNTIHCLETQNGAVFSHEDKESVLYQHFSSQFSRPAAREYTFNWEELGMQSHDLSHLEEDFSEKELCAVIKDIAADKAPGPDGFIGHFLKKAWPVIKGDLLQALQYFFHQHGQHLQHLSTAHIVLLPKKQDSKKVQDFQPISLIHLIAKLISKCLATRLAPELNNLV
jgi:hypothetical protein